jgi:hypothetical protein
MALEASERPLGPVLLISRLSPPESRKALKRPSGSYKDRTNEKESSEPERVRVFWENARKCFDEYEAKA